jgi:hypothetical protein
MAKTRSMGELAIEGEVEVTATVDGEEVKQKVWTQVEHPSDFESTVEAERWIKGEIMDGRLSTDSRYRVIRIASVLKFKTETRVVAG